MVSHGKDIHINHIITDTINQSVLFRNSSRPFSAKISFQRFGLANPCKWVCHNVLQKSGYPFHDFLIVTFQPKITIFQGRIKQNYFHKSSRLILVPFPSAISLSPFSKIFIIAGDDEIYSVSSCSSTALFTLIISTSDIFESTCFRLSNILLLCMFIVIVVIITVLSSFRCEDNIFFQNHKTINDIYSNFISPSKLEEDKGGVWRHKNHQRNSRIIHGTSRSSKPPKLSN